MMIKWVVRDYFKGYSGKNIIKSLKNGAGFLVLYIWWLTLMYFNDILKSDNGILLYTAVFIPMICVLISGVLHIEITLPKIMYLCPMSESLRKEYVEKSCGFRIVVSLIPVTIGIVVLLVSGMADLLSLMGIFISEFILAYGLSGINMNGFGKGRDGINMILSIVTICIYTVLLYYNYCKIDWLKYMVVAVFLGIQIPLALKSFKHWKPAIERAASYNKSFVTGKEKNSGGGRW